MCTHYPTFACHRACLQEPIWRLLGDTFGKSLLGRVPAWRGGFCLGESLTEQTSLLHPYLGKEACRALPPHEHSPNTARTHSEHKSRRKGRKRLKHSRAGNYRKLKSWKHSGAGNSSAGPGYVFCCATVTQSEALERRKLKRQARLRFLPCDSYTT